MILQIGHLIHDKSYHPMTFMCLLHRHMKSVSKASDKPLFQKLFDDPNATSIGDQQLLSELNIKINQNPNFVLPEGFIKIRQPMVFERCEAPPYT